MSSPRWLPKKNQDNGWSVSRETEDQRFRALAKMEKKSCDLMVLNGARAIGAAENTIEIIDRAGNLLATYDGGKEDVARELFRLIGERLIAR